MPDSEPNSALAGARGFVCSACGSKRADVSPDWRDQPHSKLWPAFPLPRRARFMKLAEPMLTRLLPSGSDDEITFAA